MLTRSSARWNGTRAHFTKPGTRMRCVSCSRVRASCDAVLMTQLQQLITCPPEMRPYLVRPCWLCLHLAVLCLSEHLLVPVERESLGLPNEQGQEIARALFLASKVR
jgi:hypothetical protein